MPKTLSSAQQKRIKTAIYKKADEFGYMTCGRIESGRFMDSLVEDPQIGGVLKEYMSKEKVRTYIKDGVLNAYTKARNKKVLSEISPEGVVKSLFNNEANVIQRCSGKNAGVVVLRSNDGAIFVVSSGTTLKWETALRKALELIAREPKLVINNCTPHICLILSEASQALTDADRNHIEKALEAIAVKAVFCGKPT